MEGRMDIGVNKGKPMKRTSKNRVIRKKKGISLFSKIPGFIKYLKSDSYFYSHLISSSLPSDSSAVQNVFPSSTVFEKNKPILRSDGNLKETLLEYLKSDTYMYAPLETKSCDDIAVKNVISMRGHEVQFTRVTGTVLSRTVAWQTKQVAQDSMVKKRGVDYSLKEGDHGLKGFPHDARTGSPQTPGLAEGKKQSTRRSGRLSTVSG